MQLRPAKLVPLAAAVLLAPLAVSAADLPNARTLMDRHIKAIGGAKAIAKSSDGTTRATMDIVEAGMKGDLTMHQRGADMVMVLVFPNFGETKIGMTDGLVWSIDPQNGPRLLEGKERDQFAQQNDDKRTLRDKRLIESATTTALADSEGRPCYRVEIKWRAGDSTADCYAVDNGLLLSTESTVSSPMGELKQVSHLYDYKPVGPVKAPYTAKNKMAGMTQQYTLLSYDAAKPARELFALPPSIAALLKKQQEAAAGAQP